MTETMKRFAYIIGLAILLVAVSFSTTIGQETDFKTLNSDLVLPDADLKVAKEKVWKGDAESAFKIYLHYSYGKFDSITGWGWLLIAANKGHAGAQYTLGYLYMNESLIKNIPLARFWLKEAEKNGETRETELLEELEESESKKTDHNK